MNYTVWYTYFSVLLAYNIAVLHEGINKRWKGESNPELTLRKPG